MVPFQRLSIVRHIEVNPFGGCHAPGMTIFLFIPEIVWKLYRQISRLSKLVEGKLFELLLKRLCFITIISVLGMLTNQYPRHSIVF